MEKENNAELKFYPRENKDDKKFYDFEVTPDVTIMDIEAYTETEARTILTKRIAQYFKDTGVDLSKKKAEVVRIYNHNK